MKSVERCRDGSADRAGVTLLEVVVSFLVMTIGVMAVLAMFPAAIRRITAGIDDTRVTMLALDAQATIRLMNWPDDDCLIRPAISPLGVPTVVEDRALPLPPAFTDERSSAYAKITSAVQPIVDPIQRPPQNSTSFDSPWHPPPPSPYGSWGDFVSKELNPYSGPGPGFPVYVDPVLACNSMFQGATSGEITAPHGPPVQYKRVCIRSSSASSLSDAAHSAFEPFKDHLFDMPIYSVSDIVWSPGGGNQRNWTPRSVWPSEPTSRRSSMLLHWFYSDGDLAFEPSNPSIPLNPRRYDSSMTASQFINAESRAGTFTAQRTPIYSWSFVVQNRRLVEVEGKIVPVPRSWKPGDIQILVFRQRNLADPYRLVRGCIFNGSRVVTLSWPKYVDGRPYPAPKIQRGTYLMEYTVSGGERSQLNICFRRNAISFLRVATFEDPVLVQGAEYHQKIILEQPVTNYPIVYNRKNPLDIGDDRMVLPSGMPDDYTLQPTAYRTVGTVRSTNLTFFASRKGPKPRDALLGPGEIPDPPPDAATEGGRIWVPIIIWDGLVEVFDVRN